jgi:hypothetical protein
VRLAYQEEATVLTITDTRPEDGPSLSPTATVNHHGVVRLRGRIRFDRST